MKSYLENSFIFRIYIKISDYYKNSVIKKISDILLYWYKNSIVHRMIVNFVSKKPTFSYSLTFRILKYIFCKLECIIGKIVNFFKNQINDSLTMLIYRSFKHSAKKSTRFLIILFTLCFLLGYCLIITKRGLWSYNKLINISF